MRQNLCFLILILLFSSDLKSQNISQEIFSGEKYAKEQIVKALKESIDKPIFDTLIKDKKTAIAIAEPILYRNFGEEQIISERPYVAYLVNGYWYIAGTLQKGKRGGTFEIIFSAFDGKIIKMIHYQ